MMYRSYILILILLIPFVGTGQDWSTTGLPFSNSKAIRAKLSSTNFLEREQVVKRTFDMQQSAGLKSTQSRYTLDSIVEREWSAEFHTLVNSGMHQVEYVEGRQEVVHRFFNRDTMTNSWEIQEEDFYRYNSKGQLIQTEFQEVVISYYRLYTRTDYEYEHGLLRFETRTDRIDEQEEWSKLERIEYKHDSLQRLSRVLVKDWDPYEEWWNTYFIVELSYNQSGLLVKMEYFDYEQGERDMDKISEWQYTYDEFDRLILAEETILGWEENVFVPEQKYVYDYETDNKGYSESIYKWDYDDGWEARSKTIFSEEHSGTLIYQITQQTFSSGWKNSQMASFYSDNQYEQEQVINSDFLIMHVPFFVFQNKVSDYVEQYVWNEGEWLLDQDMAYSFTLTPIVSSNELKQPMLRIYPNPADEQFLLSQPATSVRICDLNGTTLRENDVSYSGRVDVQDLPSGMYLIQILDKNEIIYLGKIMILH